ncbi:toprim domain-containing protein [Comamonas sp. w2-DMI]|uniref:DUF7146 domain-containing protein n=1 Tax=Comamonas sp. w2-DMI TaxID=3126391 RepID=UPI0032E3E60E
MTTNKPTDLVKDWPTFFRNMGVPEEALTGKHAECPLPGCHWKNGFRTAIKNKPGVWVCAGCSNSAYSNPLEFIKRFNDFSTYAEAANFIRNQLGGTAQVSPRPPVHKPDPATEKEAFEREVQKRAWIYDKLAIAVTEGDPVWKYLKRRIPELLEIPKEIRYMPKAQYWDKVDGVMKMLGEYPAMLVRGMDSEDRCVQLHTTFLTPDGFKAPVDNPKKVKTSIGSSSFCYRLSDLREDGVLGLAEGIETSTKCAVRFGHTVWACHSNTVLANFVLPEWVLHRLSKVIIYADNDGWRRRPDGTFWNPGVTKARELAERLRKVKLPSGQRLKVQISYTARIGDFVDV